jgi:hypothetical protein
MEEVRWKLYRNWKKGKPLYNLFRRAQLSRWSRHLTLDTPLRSRRVGDKMNEIARSRTPTTSSLHMSIQNDVVQWLSIRSSLIIMGLSGLSSPHIRCDRFSRYKSTGVYAFHFFGSLTLYATISFRMYCAWLHQHLHTSHFDGSVDKWQYYKQTREA